ncbi:exported hypothetical protein [Thiomonas sp. X19]|uniref:hypothetical protein n=1 Tax=Thiomonas sp. X19 TaxID=1050370 RepID=UPI000B6ED652|nr:hypothetical protein [Thiomonas sp. X19]SCC94938.1 exported hypothetical protein [Thiomonas sp. X19]
MHHTKKSIIAAVLFCAAFDSHAAQVQQPQSFFMPPPVVLKAEPVSAKSGANFVTVVTSHEGLMRLALRARDAHDYAARHGYAISIAAVCDPNCQVLLEDLPSVAMAAQSFGVQFIRGDATTVQQLVSQGWIKGPSY